MEPVSSALPPYALESVLCLVAAFLLYNHFNSPFNYWKKRGVPQIDVQLPFVGNFFRTIFHPLNIWRLWGYKEYPNERFVGSYENRTPTLLIRDPDLVEYVLIKDFAYMPDRTNTQNPENKMSKTLVNLTGDHWKQYRGKLMQTFSSGKLKGMHSQITDCAASLIKYMKKFEDGRPFEVRDVLQAFTMDVIVSTAFGLNIDTINDPDSQFKKVGIALFTSTTWAKIRSMLRIDSLVLAISSFIGIKSSFSEIGSLITNTVEDTIDYRKKNNIVRPDFLHLMNELKEKDMADPTTPFPFDHNALISNAFVFFVAGFETTATTISYILYELALHEDVQEKLYEEVARVLKKHNGEVSFAAINEMEYMDQVLSEALRLYPPTVTVSRKVVKPYQIPGTDLVIPPGMKVVVPAYSLHHDPQYFPEPEKFKPERFDETKNIIRKGTYLPFGGGPRMCIAARFARQETLVCLAMLISNYRIVKCDKTVIPMKFDPAAILLAPKGGIWLSIKPRASSGS